MRSLTTTTRRQYIALKAPQLRNLITLWFRLSESPRDRSAQIQLSLLEKNGLDRCARCSQKLQPSEYSRTTTNYSDKASIKCKSCATEFVIEEKVTV